MSSVFRVDGAEDHQSGAGDLHGGSSQAIQLTEGEPPGLRVLRTQGRRPLARHHWWVHHTGISLNHFGSLVASGATSMTAEDPGLVAMKAEDYGSGMLAMTEQGTGMVAMTGRDSGLAVMS